jgi:hypothetical protein
MNTAHRTRICSSGRPNLAAAWFEIHALGVCGDRGHLDRMRPHRVRERDMLRTNALVDMQILSVRACVRRRVRWRGRRRPCVTAVVNITFRRIVVKEEPSCECLRVSNYLVNLVCILQGVTVQCSAYKLHLSLETSPCTKL